MDKSHFEDCWANLREDGADFKCVALRLKFLDLGPRVSSPGNTAEAFREET